MESPLVIGKRKENTNIIVDYTKLESKGEGDPGKSKTDGGLWRNK